MILNIVKEISTCTIIGSCLKKGRRPNLGIISKLNCLQLGGQIYTPPPHGHNKKKCFGAVLVDKFLIACSLLQVLLSEKSFPVNAGKLFLGVRLGK